MYLVTGLPARASGNGKKKRGWSRMGEPPAGRGRRREAQYFLEVVIPQEAGLVRGIDRCFESSSPSAETGWKIISFACGTCNARAALRNFIRQSLRSDGTSYLVLDVGVLHRAKTTQRQSNNNWLCEESRPGSPPPTAPRLTSAEKTEGRAGAQTQTRGDLQRRGSVSGSQIGRAVEERFWRGWIGGVGISIWHRGGLRLGRIPQLPKEPVAFSRLWTVSSAVTARALPRPWQGGCTRAKRKQQNTSKRNRATRRAPCGERRTRSQSGAWSGGGCTGAWEEGWRREARAGERAEGVWGRI